MSASSLLPLVDDREFRKLFIDELGWNNPDRPQLQCDVDGTTHSLSQVAGYRGLRIWVCDTLPDKKTQREIDKQVGQDNLERLVIFVGPDRQEWRWPRRAQTGGVNAKLLMHRHLVGEPDPHLDRQLRAIEIDLDSAPSLVDLLSRMRAAFDVESETASVQAARLMGTLYGELDASKVSSDDATLLLARLLFLLFGDDSGMWKMDSFHTYLVEQTNDETLHTDLAGLFDVLNTEVKERRLGPASPLVEFRYINGGLFKERLSLPPLTSGFRTALLSACDFDWQVISPAVFGSMFQTVKDKEARRRGGEHYTTEENILKTIRPLFLDELHEKLKSAWNNKGQLTKLHNQLGRLRFLDPACGCGNFLVVAYRELRALELELLKRRRDLDEADGRSAGRNLSQGTLDVTGDIKVTLDHFYGIEIEGWPARIAETAMLLVDHLANQRMEEDFGLAPDRLPIKLAPTIVHGNALHLDWRGVVSPSDDVIIVGNPPFKGPKERSAQQTADLRSVWASQYDGFLNYVTAWYAKAVDYFQEHAGSWAFVSTNSICQGQAVPSLWRPIFSAGWRIKFAHRSFPWSSEANGAAAVHCVIIGFTKDQEVESILIEHGPGPVNDRISRVRTISAYLVDGPNLFAEKRMHPISPDLPEVTAGSKAVDWGYLTVEPHEYEEVSVDPLAAQYLRPYKGGDELINGQDRWCLWFEGAEIDQLNLSPLLRKRLAAVRERRLVSSKAATRKGAGTPHLFEERRQPRSEYLGIPQTFTDNRRYATVSRLPPDVIASIKLFTSPDPEGYLFAIISSAMFITWQKTVGGRMKSDPSFTNTIVWNTLPLPSVKSELRSRIIEAGHGILAARALSPEKSLADHYDPDSMTAELVAAHLILDLLVDEAFGAKRACETERERQRILFTRYQELTFSKP